MAPTTMEDNQTATMAPPPYISTVDLFSRPSHCTGKKKPTIKTEHTKPNQTNSVFSSINGSPFPSNL
jgi:hypothetical protein